jgi:hypothetical protein
MALFCTELSRLKVFAKRARSNSKIVVCRRFCMLKARYRAVFGLIIVAVLVSGCTGGGGKDGFGSLVISVDMPDEIEADFTGRVKVYGSVMTSANMDEFTRESAIVDGCAVVELAKLLAGSWDIDVKVIDDEDAVIYDAYRRELVEAGETTRLAVVDWRPRVHRDCD